MKRRAMPELADTGRRYVENTARARLQGPGVERYAARARPSGGRAAAVAIAIALGAAAVAVVIRLLR